MSLTDLFRRKRKLTLKHFPRKDLGENIVEVKRYVNGKEIKPIVLAYLPPEEFVKAVYNYQR